MTATRAPQTREELEDGLQALIQGAESNGVSVKGGYVIRSENHQHDWEIELFEVVKREKVPEN